MQSFIATCKAQPSYVLQRATLRRIVAVPPYHARFINTLARLEYVGVRKMLKSRSSATLDLDGLRHVVEEAVHATRLKKAALALAGDPSVVATFAEAHTLEGDAAEAYFQAVDAEAAAQVSAQAAELGESREARPVAEACYLLTSAAIEVRAHVFYPAYQEQLQLSGSHVSVASIIADEQAHLQQMASGLPRVLPDWRSALKRTLEVEEMAFSRYLSRVNDCLDRSDVEPQ